MEMVEEPTEKGPWPPPEETQVAAAGHCGICRLPVDCISHVLSFTSPGDACRSSAVSSLFRSAADSDAVWERLLPPDYPSILSRAVDPVECASKKDLFLRLCDRPLLLDGGMMSFALERESGAMIYMLSARALGIVWGGTPQYWAWIPLSNSRFSEGAELLAVCWLEIHGRIESKLLCPKTTYGAYLIFEVSDESHGLQGPAQETSVTLGDNVSANTVCLRPNAPATGRLPYMHGVTLPFWRGRNIRWLRGRRQQEETRDGVTLPQARSDGWMEIEMGAFYNDRGEDGKVDMSLVEIKGGHWKKGLIVQGIEIRPKKPQGL